MINVLVTELGARHCALERIGLDLAGYLYQEMSDGWMRNKESRGNWAIDGSQETSRKSLTKLQINGTDKQTGMNI